MTGARGGGEAGLLPAAQEGGGGVGLRAEAPREDSIGTIVTTIIILNIIVHIIIMISLIIIIISSSSSTQ